MYGEKPLRHAAAGAEVKRRAISFKESHMPRTNSSIFLCIAFAALTWTVAQMAQAQSPQETLNQFVAELQKSPNDHARREKIIRHVQTMSPAPTLPLEAERYEGRAEFAVKNARNEADFLDAALEYGKALLVAPWVGPYYFNQGIAYEKAGKLQDAKRSFGYYLLAEPSAKDAREVRKRIAGLEFAIERAARGPGPAAVVPEANPFQELLRKMDGRRYTFKDEQGSTPTIDVRGSVFVLGVIEGYAYPRGVYREVRRLEIAGMKTTTQWFPLDPGGTIAGFRGINQRATYEIRENGDEILVRVERNTGMVWTELYRRQ